MILQPGISLAVFRTFHMPVDWRDRLLLSAGVDRDGDGFMPRAPWRVPDDHELGCLCSAIPSNLRDALFLSQLPRHLRLTWEAILDRALESDLVKMDGFDPFVGEVSRFLAFKQMPVANAAVSELVVRAAGNNAQFLGEPAGNWWGGINLGEEPTSLVYLNVTDPKLPPDYPAVRLRIDPGEGFRLPRVRMNVAVCTIDKTEPDFILRITDKNDS